VVAFSSTMHPYGVLPHIPPALLVVCGLQNGFDVESTDDNGNTPLHYAAGGYDTSVLELLLTHGADIDAVNENNETPLFNAYRDENNELAEFLIKKGAGE
jgi:ankyrin repeat protein